MAVRQKARNAITRAEKLYLAVVLPFILGAQLVRERWLEYRKFRPPDSH